MKKQAKIPAIILCFAILTGCLFGIVSSAAEGESVYTATIAENGKNVVYGEKMYMAIAITTEVAGAGVATYRDAEATDCIHRSYTIEKDENEKEYYVTYGISAKEINTTFYYAVVDASGNRISEVLPYSIAAYAGERLADTGISSEQNALYEAIIAYGNAADKIFGTNQGTN